MLTQLLSRINYKKMRKRKVENAKKQGFKKNVKKLLVSSGTGEKHLRQDDDIYLMENGNKARYVLFLNNSEIL